MQQQPQLTKPPYMIYITREYFYLCCSLEHMSAAEYLKIERETCKVETIEGKQFFQQVKGVQPLHAMLIVGILILCNEIYLLYVSSATIAYPYPKTDQIYQAQSIIHIPFRPSVQYKHSRSKKSNQQILKYLQQTLLKKNFYFRYRSDITLSLQNIKLYTKTTENKFFWNSHLVRIFKQNNTHKCWRIPLMQGFIKYETFSKDCHYLMITRRSKILSGPKLLNRGIWQGDGQSVANFVQTEEIYKIRNDTFSYVSLRGSLPIYWRQSKGTMQFKTDQKNPIGFHSHLAALQKSYPQKRIYFISWLMRQRQQLLLKQVIYLNKEAKKLDICFFHSKQNYHENQKYRLISIDIDQNNKNAMYYLKELIHNQVSLLMPYKDNFFWLTEENGKEHIMGKQKLIYRVNCVDCTQRTNAVMIELSRKTLRDVQEMLAIKYNKSEVFDKLEEIVVNKWKQLGNRICRLYLGQQQLQIGKKQQSGFFTMFNLWRDPANSQFRQKSLQLFLNQITPKQVLWIQKNLEHKLNITDHCIITSLKFFILTWNCNNLNPLSINELSKEMLLKFNRGKVDVVVVNLQEMVELSTYNVLVTIDEDVKTKWKEMIVETLNDKIANEEEKFDFVAEENLVAIMTWVFVKNRVKVKHFQRKQSTLVKTGFANGLGGNKGAVMIFLKFDSTWISLINCHLTAGQGKKAERKQSLELILYGWLEEKFKNKLEDSDITFLIGDLNFRLEWSQEEIKSVLYQVKKKFSKDSLKMGLNINQENEVITNNLKTLWQRDELITYQRDTSDFLSNFRQKPLAFMPTYKFIKKSHIDEYDDKRSPAWCDRILYEEKMNGIVNQIIYQDIDMNLSDHKPVYGLFEVKIKKIDNKEEYVKRFEQEKKLYYSQKSNILKGKDSSGRIKNQMQDKKKSLNNNEIDFFAQNKVHNTQNELLIDLETNNNKKSTSPSRTQNLLQVPTFSEVNKKKSSGSPSKNDFLQFHQIINEIERTSNNNKKNEQKNSNLLDLA